MERNQYSNEELAEMIAVYCECRKNQRQAAALYAQRFPDKQHPAHSFFYRLFERLRTSGGFSKSRRPIHIRQRRQETINAVQQVVRENPHTSTRAIAADLNMNHITVHKIIKHSLHLHPYKKHIVQRLVPGDMLRRLNFCDWFIEHVSLFKNLFYLIVTTY